MHLAMNTRKAVFKLVLHWAASLDQGPALKKCLQSLLESVKELRLPFIPCHTFKNEMFGGWIAENYLGCFDVLWMMSLLPEKPFKRRWINPVLSRLSKKTPLV
jgi:hypothetical protein